MEPAPTSSLALVRKQTSRGMKLVLVLGRESIEVCKMEGTGDGVGVGGSGNLKSDMV